MSGSATLTCSSHKLQSFAVVRQLQSLAKWLERWTTDLKLNIGEDSNLVIDVFHNSGSGMILKFFEKLLSLTIPSEWSMIFSIHRGSLLKNEYNAGKAVWFTRQQCIRVISAFLLIA